MQNINKLIMVSFWQAIVQPAFSNPFAPKCKNKCHHGCTHCITAFVNTQHNIKALQPSKAVIAQYKRAVRKGIINSIVQGYGTYIYNNLQSQVSKVIAKRYSALSNYYYNLSLHYGLV